MEKTKLVKIFLVALMSLAIVFTTTLTYAAETPSSFVDVTNSNASSSNSNSNSSNSNSENTNSNNSNTNTNSNSNSNTNSNNNSNSLTSNTNTNNTSSSNYNNNANLPKTGIAETGSMICVLFALAVSAGYAYKKLKDYNI